MIINANTKIGTILKQHPEALEAIVSVNPIFEKLRNPVLRKLMAGRTSLAMASKVGGCTVDDFFDKLQPLGFEIDKDTKVKEEVKTIPQFMRETRSEQIIELDVRPNIASGNDPLNLIMNKLKTVQPGQVLKIINSFEPTPLIHLLEKKGYQSYVEQVGEKHIATYFYKKKNEIDTSTLPVNSSNDWDELMSRFETSMQVIDVRELEMPKPMHTILEALEQLPQGDALFVYHKRIPVYLLQELSDRGFDYRIKELSEGQVHLLIFRNGV